MLDIIGIMKTAADILRQAFLCARDNADERNSAADSWMDLLRQGDIYAIDSAAQQARAAGIALANRFIFACLDDNPAEERAVWVFMPLDQWARTRQLYAVSGPIAPLLPDGAIEIAEGTWMWDDAKSKIDRAMSLMAHGFVWHPAFQKRVDRTQVELTVALARANRAAGPRP